MYRVVKVLNHNAVLAVEKEKSQECLLMGKGIGFGKKVSEQLSLAEDVQVYHLQATSQRGDTRELVKTIPPEYFELANLVLDKAEETFGHIDRNILFPLADHLYYAVERIKKHEEISNPLTEDIRILFHMEYKVASCIIPALQEKFGIAIGEDEVGYITLHVHSAIEDDHISDAMKMAKAVRACVEIVEEAIEKKINVLSISYNRLMNHVRYMIVRALKGEDLKMSLNDYMMIKYPKEYLLAKKICQQIEQTIGCQLKEPEIGYLAMHICRVISDETEE